MAETPKNSPASLPDQGRGETVSDELNSVIQQLTGGRSPEQMQADIKQGKWPFAVSEAQMRADIESWKVPGATADPTESTDKK